MSPLPPAPFPPAPARRNTVLSPLLAAALLLVLPLIAACARSTDQAPAAGEPGYEERMSREHAGETPQPTSAAEQAPAVPVDEQEVVYAQLGDREVRGFLAQPANPAGPMPGIVVIHEWWGLNDNVRAMAKRLAGEGYMALAVDLYEGESADTPERARELMTGTNDRTADLEDNLRQAVDFLERQGAESIGVIGWCFGGGWSLQTALLVPGEIDATVVYYGRLVTDPDQLAALQSPLLGNFGALDQGIPVASVKEFEAALDELGKDYDIKIYEGAGHAFANPSGERYEAAAAEDAWKRTLAFFADNLKSQ